MVPIPGTWYLFHLGTWYLAYFWYLWQKFCLRGNEERCSPDWLYGQYGLPAASHDWNQLNTWGSQVSSFIGWQYQIVCQCYTFTGSLSSHWLLQIPVCNLVSPLVVTFFNTSASMLILLLQICYFTRVVNGMQYIQLFTFWVLKLRVTNRLIEQTRLYHILLTILTTSIIKSSFCIKSQIFFHHVKMQDTDRRHLLANVL